MDNATVTIRKEIIRKVFLHMDSASRAKLKERLTPEETLVLAEALDLGPGEEIAW